MPDPGLPGPLRQVAQRASDLDRSVAFYRDVLGLEFIARYDPPGLAFLWMGEVRLLLEAAAQPATLYFRVDDVHRARRDLEARGVVFEDEPQRIFVDDHGTFGPAGEEEWMTFFRDPDGTALALAARVPRR